jgi:putative transposase
LVLLEGEAVWGRPLRAAPADTVYHVLNRANARLTLFEDDGDYLAFQRVLAQACDRVGMTYCVMPNHWHLVVWPRGDGDLSRFMNWLTLTHMSSIGMAGSVMPIA